MVNMHTRDHILQKCLQCMKL